MHIGEYLVKIAEHITDKDLPNLLSLKKVEEWRQKRQVEFHKMLGIDTYLEKERTPLNVTITGEIRRNNYRIEKLYYESLPGLYVTANLYIPNDLKAPAPAIVYLCGHSSEQKVHYQDHPRKFAKLGFVTLIIDTIQYGEVRGIHHGTYSHRMYDWISKGYTPAAVEVWNAIRGIDLLQERSDVDAERIGMTGQSGGGSISWWAAAADDRVKTIAASCGTGTIFSHIREETINTHCDCVFPSNPYGWSLIETCALLAPRPILIITPDQDMHFQVDSVRFVHQKLQDFYRSFECGNLVKYIEFYGPHSYSADSRKAIFGWFLDWLTNKSNTEATDVDEWREEKDALLVYNHKLPTNDESTSVQDWFIPTNSLNVRSKQEHQQRKTELIENLQKESFAAFPKAERIPPLQVDIHQKYCNKNKDWVVKFTYQSDAHWRLAGELCGHAGKAPSKTAIVLKNQKLGVASQNILDGLGEDWVKANIDTRGTGITAWGEKLDWYLRRSFALTGRTIASIRVWDTLRGIDAVRNMQEVDAKTIVLAAEGEMVVPALYAALLDGNIAAVILKNPPATQNISKDGSQTSQHLEIINCLRYTDLAHLAGMLWPTKIIFVGDRPKTFDLTEKMHRELGGPGDTWKVASIKDWVRNFHD
ncbi:alpha/beta hydrolase family protein [Radiobacillus sp. PE A8.2]|uniref:alpha/beta hydrolase family protein n=1 Tax=Radiobacillus sp. PE A8.2 TaxID=3380349 RepID=UPI0038902558